MVVEQHIPKTWTPWSLHSSEAFQQISTPIQTQEHYWGFTMMCNQARLAVGGPVHSKGFEWGWGQRSEENAFLMDLHAETGRFPKMMTQNVKMSSTAGALRFSDLTLTNPEEQFVAPPTVFSVLSAINQQPYFGVTEFRCVAPKTLRRSYFEFSFPQPNHEENSHEHYSS